MVSIMFTCILSQTSSKNFERYIFTTINSNDHISLNNQDPASSSRISLTGSKSPINNPRSHYHEKERTASSLLTTPSRWHITQSDQFQYLRRLEIISNSITSSLCGAKAMPPTILLWAHAKDDNFRDDCQKRQMSALILIEERSRWTENAM